MSKKEMEERLHQPIYVVTWKKHASVKVVPVVAKGVTGKMFIPIVYNEKKASLTGLPVSSRSKALAQAIEHCNTVKFRIIEIDGVREEKYIIW